MSLLEIKKVKNKKTQRDTRSLLQHVIAPYDVITSMMS